MHLGFVSSYAIGFGSNPKFCSGNMNIRAKMGS